MLRLAFGSLQHVRRHGLCSAILVSSVKPKLASLRRTFPRKTPSNRSASTSSYIMDDTCQGTATLDDVIAGSKNSSDIQKVAVELPEVARIPSRKRTFHLDYDDLDTLVRPLLSCHWHVGRVGGVTGDFQVFSLNKLFSFKDFRSAVEFFDGLVDVQNEENHHARVTVDYASVYVSIYTHIAYQHSSDADADAKPIKVPGLTVRDIRFAVKVEGLHARFLTDERAVTKVPTDSANIQAWSMEQLRRRYPASRA